MYIGFCGALKSHRHLDLPSNLYVLPPMNLFSLILGCYISACFFPGVVFGVCICSFYLSCAPQSFRFGPNIAFLSSVMLSELKQVYQQTITGGLQEGEEQGRGVWSREGGREGGREICGRRERVRVGLQDEVCKGVYERGKEGGRWDMCGRCKRGAGIHVHIMIL